MNHERKSERGVALITALMLLVLLMTMMLGYFSLTQMSLSTVRSTKDGIDGLYAAEAGLNIRAEGVRQVFEGYGRPAGLSPDPGADPCSGSNMGSGDMACLSYPVAGKTADTYLLEDPTNPEMIVIPRGELYQNLNAQEYAYTADSVTRDGKGRPHAILALEFRSRLVPLFQFAAFYDKDLEILPGPAMLLEGPVHVNGDLYLGANSSLDIDGQVTTSGDLYRGRKNGDSCMTGAVNVFDPENPAELPTCSGGRELLVQSDLDAWNGQVETHVDRVTVPPAETLDPTPGEPYWDKAEVRVVLDLNGATPAIVVRNTDGSDNALDTAALDACDVTDHSTSMYNHREAEWIDMLEIDVTGLLDCLHTTTIMGAGKDIDETSEGGLVWYFTIDGPDSVDPNNYGVRLRNGGELASTVAGAPDVAGLTVVTDQAIYVEGDYNAVEKKPAAVMADSLNVLSNAWNDANSAESDFKTKRVASSTTINSAFLGGTDSTGGLEGAAGQDGGDYNGGLENYPRFHEHWAHKVLTYRGSFVSLDLPRHVDGHWDDQSYSPPIRDWRYDTDFNDAANLPPLSPRFVYLTQRLFLRKFEL